MNSRPATASPRLLRRFAIAAIVTNVGIVVTGGVVRVTGSGLGCPNWPTCDGTNLIPRAGSGHNTWQTAIEFGNRLLTFVVLAAAVGLVFQLRRARPQTVSRATLTERLGWMLVAGILSQALLGGVTVLTGLSPFTVAAHFLVSMLLISLSAIIYELVRPITDDTPTPTGIRHATTALVLIGAVVLVLGTITTGSGPHGGDVSAGRFGVDIRLIAIAHADAVWALIGLTVALLAVTWRSGPPRLRSAVRLLAVLQLVQGGIGYSQYALGVPRWLVILHIAGAALVWLTLSSVWIRARSATWQARAGQSSALYRH